jgi:alkylation response protein AidB-like acyl-CoA dehydrogenase
MDLEFSEEQQMLRELVRGVCGTYAPLTTVRELEDDPTGYPPELWKQLAELDLIGLMIPSEYGGSGMTAVEGAIVYEELGRALAPTPHFVSAVLTAGALLRAGTEEQKQAWLPRLASGDAIVSTAWIEPHHGFGPRGVQLRARRDGDDYVLDGVKWHVPFASAAGHLLVLARTGEGEADVDLFLVDAASAGVVLTQQLTIASDTQYEVAFSGVRVPAANRVGGDGTGWATWHDTMLDGVLLLAAQAIGGARHTLDITVQYAKDRKQFDKPLGAFQAISHYLADASTAVEGATVLVYEAAWARANGRSVDRLAPMAKLFACQTFRDVTAMAQQIFGGVGFTLEYDVQLYFRRAKQLQVSWWNDRYLEELVAAQTLDRDDTGTRLPAPWRGPVDA